MKNDTFIIIQNMDKSIEVMLDAGKWLENSKRKPSQWWQPKNMNREFLIKHTEPNEFYSGMLNGEPVASMVLQETERNQSWQPIDGNKPKHALYVHWLCVSRKFAGQGYSNKMIDHAIKEAKTRGFSRLRLDTEADEIKLCHLYEELGFQLMGTETEKNGHQTAFYQMDLN